MRLLTNGEEHNGIGDEGRLVMTTVTISPLRSPERTPDLPSRGRTGGGGASVSQTRRKLLFLFFLDERQLIELELGVAGACGPHKPAHRHQGVVAEPGLVAHWPTP